jgi:hypothetical protein
MLEADDAGRGILELKLAVLEGLGRSERTESQSGAEESEWT